MASASDAQCGKMSVIESKPTSGIVESKHSKPIDSDNICSHKPERERIHSARAIPSLLQQTYIK
ncbi:hypothetical protein [uncultured Helicobacter sp.]|uniref:hypothetical protein n=1 Tax=uncultured Helicobacter sp. TaxID=175537 RepID=UPI00375287CB